MAKIQIIATPPGFAPLAIREQWLNVEIPLLSNEELAADPPSEHGIGEENSGGYTVLHKEAVQALRENGRDEAARYWSAPWFGKYLVFHELCCKLIP